MRSGLLTALALALAGVGEAQWAIAYAAQSHAIFDALMSLLAGVGLAVAAFGFYHDADGRSVASPAGLAMAAGAHLGLIVAHVAEGTLTVAGPVTLATFAGALGLLLAAYGARKGAPTLRVAQAGLALACACGILWFVGDAIHGVRAFAFGDVLVPLGWGLAAMFVRGADSRDEFHIEGFFSGRRV